MSPDELRNIDAEIAVKLFGWRWFRLPARGGGDGTRVGLWPPDTAKYIRWNFPEHLAVDVTGSEVQYRRFNDWDRCGSKSKDADDRNLKFLPRYSTDWNAMAEMLAAVEAKGWTYSLCLVDSTPGGSSIHRRTVKACVNRIWMEGGTLPLAACLACLKAVQS